MKKNWKYLAAGLGVLALILFLSKKSYAKEMYKRFGLKKGDKLNINEDGTAFDITGSPCDNLYEPPSDDNLQVPYNPPYDNFNGYSSIYVWNEQEGNYEPISTKDEYNGQDYRLVFTEHYTLFPNSTNSTWITRVRLYGTDLPADCDNYIGCIGFRIDSEEGIHYFDKYGEYLGTAMNIGLYGSGYTENGSMQNIPLYVTFADDTYERFVMTGGFESYYDAKTDKIYSFKDGTIKDLCLDYLFTPIPCKNLRFE